MKELVILIRPEKLEDVKKILDDINCGGMTLSTVMGCGTQHGYTENIRGSKYTVNMLPKIKFEIFVPNTEWEEKVITAITQAARTGSVGDGKIISYEIGEAVRIRTGERGIAALKEAKDKPE